MEEITDIRDLEAVKKIYDNMTAEEKTMFKMNMVIFEDMLKKIYESVNGSQKDLKTIIRMGTKRKQALLSMKHRMTQRKIRRRRKRRPLLRG